MTKTIEGKFVTGKELDSLSEQGHKIELINYSVRLFDFFEHFCFKNLHLITIDAERYTARKCTGKTERYRIIEYLGKIRWKKNKD